MDKNSKIYSSGNNEYDLMIIKINEKEANDYLELDQNLFIENSELSFEAHSIYLLHYANGNNVSISFGNGIKKQSDYDIKHLCNTESCSSGGPILSLLINKIIGIHKGCIISNGDNLYNIGTFLKYPLDGLGKSKTNEIRLKVQINEKDINKKIFFLDNTKDLKDDQGIKHYHDYLKELNESNTELYIKTYKLLLINNY